VVAFALARLGRDRTEAGHRVGLVDRQVDADERVAVAVIVAGLMEADRDLDAQRTGMGVEAGEPAAQAAGDRGQHDVVDGRVLRQRVGDPLDRVELDVDEGDRPTLADLGIERGLGPAARELAV
jgi:hypothetical protein